MDALEMQRTRIVGNSLGGRIAIEIGLVAPDRTAALGLLCPAVAWIRRSLHPLVRLMRPELGCCPTRSAARWWLARPQHVPRP